VPLRHSAGTLPAVFEAIRSRYLSVRSGELVAEVPVTAAVSALSMSQDGTMLGIAQRGSLDLWQLAQEGDRCG
jgi:hypothetical protein